MVNRCNPVTPASYFCRRDVETLHAPRHPRVSRVVRGLTVAVCGPGDLHQHAIGRLRVFAVVRVRLRCLLQSRRWCWTGAMLRWHSTTRTRSGGGTSSTHCCRSNCFAAAGQRWPRPSRSRFALPSPPPALLLGQQISVVATTPDARQQESSLKTKPPGGCLRRSLRRLGVAAHARPAG